MQIEKETYLITPFIKNSFLNQSVANFSNELGNADFNQVMATIKKNKTALLPQKMLRKCRKKIYSVFNAVGNSITRDNRVDKTEIYEFVKGYYSSVKNENITNEQIDNMRFKDLLDIFVIWVKDYQKNYEKKNK